MFSANSSQVSEDRLYVEDVFSTWLYTGNGSTQTITNGIDLAGKGGLVWIKSRSAAASHYLANTDRGTSKYLSTNLSNAENWAGTYSDTLTSFNSNGFSLGGDAFGTVNISGTTYASWTFRKAPKFFDVVTYTGNGSTARAISHSLGVAPGSMIIKRTDSTGQWVVYHRSLGNANALVLESTSAQFSTNTFGYTTPDATTFTVGDYNNINGATYVAYLFAHDTTSDGIIQCGSWSSSGSPVSVNLGWEPQWLLWKNSNTATNWAIMDNMRPFFGSNASGTAVLAPNAATAEVTFSAGADNVWLNPTGFSVANPTGNGIYIAIRRGPMRTPTSGTSVFAPAFPYSTSTAIAAYLGSPIDTWLRLTRAGSASNAITRSRLQGGGSYLVTSSTAAEVSNSNSWWDNQFGAALSGDVGTPATDIINYIFRRAPSFFDVVCYTGTGSARTINHNLGVAPELIITKCRSNGTTAWMTYCSALSSPNDKYLFLNQNSAVSTVAGTWKTPTATTFGMDISFTEINDNGFTYVSYLFASCPGVSKVGSYTGNGSSQTINCGFAAGARFVMIKRTDSTGDWYVWDTARGIVAANDPRLSLNSTAAEVTTDDSVDTDSSGFVVNQLSATNINVSSATYIYLAVA